MKKAYVIRFYVGLTDKKGQPVSPEVYTRVMKQLYHGYTMFQATGCWKGKMEYSLVFEVIFENFTDSVHAAREYTIDLKKAGNQEAVLVTRQEIEAEI